VHAVDFVDAEAGHHAVVDHGFATGTAFFRRLENHHRGAVEIPRFGEIARRAQQHGGVAVMAAGMHLARRLGFIRQVVGLIDRQRVHVGAQADGLSRRAFAAADDADHAGAADARHHLVAAERLELVGDRGRRAMHVVHEFRMGMQVMPPVGDLVMQVGDAVDDGHWLYAPGGGSGPAREGLV
jgi:hypothetical protein